MRIIQGDCIEQMRAMEECSIDAIVCDPPYGIGFMGHEWDQPGAHGADRAKEAPSMARTGRDHRLGRERGGAMVAGQYDLSLSANQRFQSWCETWAREALRVLKPGGHMLVCGGTRTFHRMTSGIEDAGFEIRDCLSWLYGSGFPKSLNVSKAIDKAAGAERGAGVQRLAPVEGDDTGIYGEGNGNRLCETCGKFTFSADPCVCSRDGGPATPDAERWQGWGTALKPAWEPIVVARKPLSGTVAANVLAHGTGAINVDGCRIAAIGENPTIARRKGSTAHLANGRVSAETEAEGRIVDRRSPEQYSADRPSDALGRWPANVALGHTEDCRMVGTREVASDGHFPATCGACGYGSAVEDSNDGGLKLTEVWACVPDCPVRMLDEQSGKLHSQDPRTRASRSKTVGVTGMGTGASVEYADRGGASRFFYCAKASRAERNAGRDALTRNTHPTVKPVDLMRWLVRLVTPPGGVVLDPFAGSGTTGCAAVQEDFEFIGIEREEEYVKIAESRIAWWSDNRAESVKVSLKRSRAKQVAPESAEQLTLD
jgi:site-specific DNA-methyltransferase (adenine-specific)